MLAELAFLTLLAQAGPAPIAYSIEAQPKTAAELSKRFTPEQLDVLEKLNRRDREHLIRPDPPSPGIVVPGAWEPDELAYSPFPAEWRAVEEFPKYLVVHQPMQAFAAIDEGPGKGNPDLNGAGKCSPGQNKDTSPGGLKKCP